MRFGFLAVLADAWARFRRDADLLVRVSAPFLFLPALALQLLVPPPPGPPGGGVGTAEADALAWMEALSVWGGRHGGWYLLAYAVQTFGAGAVLALYLDPGARDVRGALARALRLLPRLLLAAALVAVPAGAGLLLYVLPGLYVLARTTAAAPVLVAEAPKGALAAVARSLALTRGAGLVLTGLVATVAAAGFLAGQPFAALAAGRVGSIPGLVVAFGATFGAAAVSALTALANALVAVSAYRALSARQGS